MGVYNDIETSNLEIIVMSSILINPGKEKSLAVLVSK